MNIPNFPDNFASMLEEMQKMTPQDVTERIAEKLKADYDKIMEDSDNDAISKRNQGRK